MWVPHTIPKSILNLFTPPDAVKSVPNEIGHGIRSEDFGWADGTPTPLKLLCLDVIARNFTRYPPELFERITPTNAAYFVEVLDTSLPIPSVIRVPDGEYWRRRHVDIARSGSAQVSPRHVTVESPKTFHLNEYVSQTVENLVPGYVDETELAELLTACSPYVTAIRCRRLRVRNDNSLDETEDSSKDPVHVDLGTVLRHLRNVESMSVVYGAGKDDDEEYSRPNAYKFGVEDMDLLGRGLVFSKHLTSLTVTKSDLNVVKFNRLLPYLVECGAIEQLDFSFCKLRSLGAKSVAHFLKTAKSLKSVDLCGNGIGSDGVEALAFVMVMRRKNDYPAIKLNLNMNNINDLGAKYLASALATEVQPLTELHICECQISELGGMSIVQSLTYDQGLRSLKIDNNPLTLEVAKILHNVMKTNFNIKYLSTQNCIFPEKMISFFNSIAFHNRHNKRSDFIYENFESLFDELEETNTSLEELTVQSENMEEVY